MTVAPPGDVEGEAGDVSSPALSAEHHDDLGVAVLGVGVAGVLGPGSQQGDEVGGVVTVPVGDTLVPALLPQPTVAGRPGEVPPVVLAAPGLDAVGEAALPAGLLGCHPPGLAARLDGEAEV